MLFLIYINDFNNCAPDIDFHLYADHSNLFSSHKSLQCLETILNNELCNINEWLCAKKLSLNTDKFNFVVLLKLHRCISTHLLLQVYFSIVYWFSRT